MEEILVNVLYTGLAACRNSSRALSILVNYRVILFVAITRAGTVVITTTCIYLNNNLVHILR